MKNDNVKLKNWENGIVVIDSLKKDQQFTVKDKENKTFVVFLTKEGAQSGEVKIIIKGEKAKVQILGLIVGEGKQKINLYTLQDHLKPESVSDLLIKSVLFNQAKFNYQGLIKIEKGAQKSNAYQKNQNLLVSSCAWANSRPYLEILANDVYCTHGATIGRIDKEELYYLKTRGLSENLATKLIINGFLNEVIQRIPSKSLKTRLEKEVSSKVSKLLERSQNLG